MKTEMCCDLDAFLRAMSDETRQRILSLVLEGEMSVTEIQEQLPVTQPTISHHLAILHRANLVSRRRVGKQVFYRINPDCVTKCCSEILVRFQPMNSSPLSDVRKKAS